VSRSGPRGSCLLRCGRTDPAPLRCPHGRSGEDAATSNRGCARGRGRWQGFSGDLEAGSTIPMAEFVTPMGGSAAMVGGSTRMALTSGDCMRAYEGGHTAGCKVAQRRRRPWWSALTVVTMLLGWVCACSGLGWDALSESLCWQSCWRRWWWRLRASSPRWGAPSWNPTPTAWGSLGESPIQIMDERQRHHRCRALLGGVVSRVPTRLVAIPVTSMAMGDCRRWWRRLGT
jgi:hypothetical protein